MCQNYLFHPLIDIHLNNLHLIYNFKEYHHINYFIYIREIKLKINYFLYCPGKRKSLNENNILSLLDDISNK